jgi:hypothetical protein
MSFNEVDLPKYDDVYGPINGGWGILRTLTFLKTDKEKDIGIGDGYDYDPIPFG